MTAATYGSASAVPQVTVNAQGQVTSASNVSISIAPSQINATIPNSGLANSSITLGNTTIALGGTATSVGNLTLNNATIVSSNVSITGGTINVQTTNITATVSSTATYGTASLPLQPLGFLEVDLNGTVVKVPYYAV